MQVWLLSAELCMGKEGLFSDSKDSRTYLGIGTSLVLTSVSLIQPRNKQPLSITHLSAVCGCRSIWVANYTTVHICALLLLPAQAHNLRLWFSSFADDLQRCWLQHFAALSQPHMLCPPQNKQVALPMFMRYSCWEHKNILSHEGACSPTIYLHLYLEVFKPEHKKYDWKVTWSKESLKKKKEGWKLQKSSELVWRQSVWACGWGPCYGWVNTFLASSAVTGNWQLYLGKCWL